MDPSRHPLPASPIAWAAHTSAKATIAQENLFISEVALCVRTGRTWEQQARQVSARHTGKSDRNERRARSSSCDRMQGRNLPSSKLQWTCNVRELHQAAEHGACDLKMRLESRRGPCCPETRRSSLTARETGTTTPTCTVPGPQVADFAESAFPVVLMRHSPSSPRPTPHADPKL